MAIQRISRIQPVGFSSSGRRSSSYGRTGRSRRSLGFSLSGADWSKIGFKPTAQQLFEMAMANQMHRHSFVDTLKGAGGGFVHGVTHGAEWAMDKLLRVNYGLAEGSHRLSASSTKYEHDHPGGGSHFGTAPHDIAQFSKGFWSGFSGKKHTTFSDVLKKDAGIKNKWVSGSLGFALDVGTDPLTYVSFGSTSVAKGGLRGAEAAAQSAGRRAIEGKAVEHAADIGHLARGGEDFKWRKALAQERKRHANIEAKEGAFSLEDITKGRKSGFTESDFAQLRQAGEAAKREEMGMSKRLPFLRIGTSRASIRTPTTIGGKQVVPTLPRVSKALEEANIPGISKTIGGFRKAVGSGKSDVIRGVRVSTKHTMEELSGRYLEFVQQALKNMPRRLDRQKAIKALGHFERKGGVEKVADPATGKIKYVLNERRIAKLRKSGELDEKQEQFVRGWHAIAEHFHAADNAFGVKYTHMGEHGKLYVPHLMDRVGMPYTIAQKNMLKKQGYTKGRKNANLTLEHIANLVKEGKLPREIETDPYKMLVSMARSRAHQHADKSAVDFLARGVGTPSRIVDKRAVNKIETHTARHDAIDLILKRFNTPSLRNLKQVKALGAEQKALANEIKKLKRGKKNKEASKDMVALEDLRDAHGNKVLVEPEIAEALTRVQKIVDPTEDASITAFRRGWASMVGRWKLLVTAVNPGYRVRNTLSDFWNMYVAGVPTWAFGRYGARAAKVLRDAKGGRGVSLEAQRKSERIISDAYKAGILSGLYGGDIQTLAHMLKYAGSKRSLAMRGKGIKLGSKIAQDMNRNAENWGRLVHYLYRREYQKMSVTDAAFEVKKAHFDYEDLTEFERQKLKGNLIPFYTWTRKNIPYQLQAMVTRPGKYATFPKFAIESEKTAGGDKGTILPDYMTKNFAFQIPMGKHAYMVPQLGMADIARFESPKTAARNVLGMVNPAFKIPAEIGLNRSFYTGQDIAPKGGHPRQPIRGWAEPFLKLIPGSNVGKTARGGGSSRVEGPGASPWISYAFGQTPWTRFAFLGGKIKDQQRGFSPMWSQFAGLQMQKIDPQQQLLMERLALKDKLKSRIRGLRDEGLYPESKARKESEYERRIQRMIAHGLGR